MKKMSQEVRKCISEIAKDYSFVVQVRRGTDEDIYDKNLMFRSPLYNSAVFISKVTGIANANGDISYLKVAVHPDEFRRELLNPSMGIDDYINRQSKVNRHHSSNYREGRFPNDIPGKNEPYGKCYKVQNLSALSVLFAGLSDRPST